MAINYGTGLQLTQGYKLQNPSSGGAEAADQAQLGAIYQTYRENAPNYGETFALGADANSALKRALSAANSREEVGMINAETMKETAKIQAKAQKSAANSQKKSSTFGSVLGTVATIGGALLSDERCKDNVQQIDNALEELRKLRPVSFNYNIKYSTSPERLHYGFIAQEYKEVMPDATYFDSSIDRYCIDTNELIALLVRSVQQLELKVGRMEAVKALEEVRS